jgi:hypothetical protein
MVYEWFGAAGARESRTRRNAAGTQGRGQCFAHGSDISTRSRIDGRAVFEHELAAALCLQPRECMKGLLHSIVGVDRSCLERNDSRSHGERALRAGSPKNWVVASPPLASVLPISLAR